MGLDDLWQQETQHRMHVVIRGRLRGRARLPRWPRRIRLQLILDLTRGGRMHQVRQQVVQPTAPIRRPAQKKRRPAMRR